MVEDLIADIIKDYKQIGQDNIVDVIKQFALRSVTIDRHPRNPTLIYFDTRTGKKEEINELQCSQLAQRVPNIRQFHSQVNMYLKQVKVILAEVATKVESSNAELHDIALSELLQGHVLPRATNSDIPVYRIEHLTEGERCVKVFHNQHGHMTHVYDRNAQIILEGVSKSTLEETRRVLNEKGFDNVDIAQRPVTASIIQQIRYRWSLLRSELLSISNVAKLMLTVLGLIVGILADNLLSPFFN